MGMFSSMKYDKVATRMSLSSKTYAILHFILVNGPTSKYDIVTKVLGKKGTSQDLRGYYCVWFQKMVKGGILKREGTTYRITSLGRTRMEDAILRYMYSDV